MKVTIISTKFENLHDGKVTYGYRVYSDSGLATYDNTRYGSAEDVPTDNMDLIADVIEDPINDMMDDMIEIGIRDKGVAVNRTWYDWEEIAWLFDEP